MNHKGDPRDRLVAGIFEGDWQSGSAAGFARRAAASARRRRAARRVVAVGAVAALAFCLLVRQGSVNSGDGRLVATAPVSAPTSEHPRPVSAPNFDILSDEQFLSEMRGAALLYLPQMPEGERVVLLPDEDPVPKTNS